ncbi:hypothetical protein [Litorilituus sediminis]|uniref:Lipoprotein n=1 Tax=Litorilituus sediminis TaxID=718192 RepID=A0A4P6P341_9GAMM|nr:hypothetical protein [Litorilituus sediminis]QBG35148.1 hypothetical protein EMK97_05145 [Litorilituus sediminis]
MKNVTLLIALLSSFILSACGSTQAVSQHDNMQNNYYTSQFNHTSFTTYNKDSVKKQLSSDHELMMSLLNRPMTQDQAMMLAFAQQRESYQHNGSATGVAIRGDKASDDNQQYHHAYQTLIAQDSNSVIISAPQ